MRVSFVAIKQVKKTIELQKEVGMAMLEQQGGRDDNNYNMHLYITYHDTHMHVCVCVCDCVHCLLYTSPSPRDATLSRMPSSA